MPDRVFCIDFGSSYTKVGLRRARWTDSELVRHPRLRDDLRVCVPTTVAIDYNPSPPAFAFGDAALARRPARRVKVFSNWKKDLFEDAARGRGPDKAARKGAPPPRLPGLVLSDEFAALARARGVDPRDVHSLRRLLSHAGALFRNPPAAPGGGPDGPAQLTSPAFRVAVQFFRYLRQTVLEACGALRPSVPDPAAIPTRVTVPAFGPEAGLAERPEAAWLCDALARAGWPLADARPVVSEPAANAIGVLSRGTNSRLAAEMFKAGRLAAHLTKPRNHPDPDYRVGVVDVGAYTADFAVLTHHHGAAPAALDNLRFGLDVDSAADGISRLDAAVLAALPPAQAGYLRDEASPDEWARLRARVYGQGGAFTLLSGEPVDGPAVGDAVAAYADRLADAVAAFFGRQDEVRFEELILTGGGCSYPAVQDALIRGAERARGPFPSVHLPAGDGGRGPTDHRAVWRLEPAVARGATALGGTSEFFELNRA